MLFGAPRKQPLPTLHTELGDTATRCNPLRVFHPSAGSSPVNAAVPENHTCRGCNASCMLSTPRACTDRSARADRNAALRLRDPDPDPSEVPSGSGAPSARCPRASSASSRAARSACARSKDSDFGVFRIRALFQNQARRRRPVRRCRRFPAPTSQYPPTGVALETTGKSL